MNKKFIPIVLVLTGASLFLAFQSQGRTDIENPKPKNEKILQNVGLLLEQGHYSPQKIDDKFSKLILTSFIEDIDNSKNIFLQSDIDGFYKKYQFKIDDEIHGAKLESFYSVSEIYTKRLNEVSGYYTEFLSKPFDFSVDENLVMDPEKLSFCTTEAMRKDTWRKYIKFLVLNKFNDSLDLREKYKDSASYTPKPDSALERYAREGVKKQMDRYFTTLKNHNTSDELFSVFVNAITNAMDPHSSYFAPIDSRSFNEQMSGSFYGIGAQLKEDQNKIKIASLVTGMPAWKSGELGVDDEIVKIAQGAAEPVDVTGYAISDAVKLIRGAEKGSEVRLTVKKVDGSIKIVILKRDEIKLEDTFAKSAIIKGEHKIGYIYLPEFYIDFNKPNGAKCSDDVAKEIEKLKAEKVEGIVMDLRGNGGGSLPEVVKMVGLFIPEGPVCQVQGRDENKPYLWQDRDKTVLYDGPLTVMIDEFSASASEIFAAAIQDYKRGVIIGSSSYGKGTVQRTIPLNPERENNLFENKTEDLGTVKLTLQKFYRVNGGATQLKGVTPDVIIPDRYENAKAREKDNKSALSWDEIQKAQYSPWVSTYSNDAVITASNTQLQNAPVYKNLKEKFDSLAVLEDKEYSLNSKKFREDLKQLKAIYKSVDKLLKLTKQLDVKNVSADEAVIAADKEKTDRNKGFIGRIKDDIYIDQALKVTNNTIGQSNLAINNNTELPVKKN